MRTPITVTIPHQLGRAEARRRIEAGFASIGRQFPGGGTLCSQRWDGDRLSFGIAALGQSITGVVEVLDAAVAMQIELPGMLGLLAKGLAGKVRDAARLLLTDK